MNDTTAPATMATTTATAAVVGLADSGASAAAVDGPLLVALDVDGTLVPEGTTHVPPITTDAVQDVIAAGHHIALATGRSLAGAMPVAASLGLTSGWIVASNGAVTARLTPNTPGGYEITDKHTLDVAPVVALVRDLMAEVAIAAEGIGVGYHVTRTFEPGLLNGRQTLTAHEQFPATTPRLVLHAPGVTDTLLKQVRTLPVTATPAGPDWIDVTPAALSKGTALYRVRRRLGIHPDRTIAIGDSINDIPAFAWATTAIAMGHAPTIVRATADATTGTLEQHGAATILNAIAADGGILPRRLAGATVTG
jgi:HAD superfamily hydrolase (TIGR01484 family)